MSWRTKGQYLGLGDSDKEWLRDFDRTWDTKSEGRSRTDAFEHMGGDAAPDAVQPKADQTAPKLVKVSSGSHDYSRFEETCTDVAGRAALEALLIRVAYRVTRFTVPKKTKVGWSIHLVMRCGKRVRAHFEDLGAAMQAYDALEEFSLWFPKG